MQQEKVATAPDTTKAVDTLITSPGMNADAEKIFDGNAVVPVVESKDKEVVEETKVEEKVETPTEYKLELPEGSLLDQAALEAVTDFAKSKGLSEEVAKEMLTREGTLLSSFVDNQKTQFVEVRKNWVESIKKDKEFGGDKFNEHAELAKRTLKEFADDEFIKGLDDTGYGDNPALFRFLVKAGKKLGIMNSGLVKSNVQASAPKEDYELFYGNSNKE